MARSMRLPDFVKENIKYSKIFSFKHEIIKINQIFNKNVLKLALDNDIKDIYQNVKY